MFKRLVLVTFAVFAIVLGSFAVYTPRAAEASSGCHDFRGNFIRVLMPTSSGNITGDFSAGETITITTSNLSGIGTHYLTVNGATVDGPKNVTEPLSYTFPSSGTYTILHVLNGEGSVNIHWSCSGVAAGGCDTTVNIPPQAVVGEFVTNASAYYEPGNLITSPPVTIEAGKTYWVAGQDATGMYRKVLLGCTWVWVEFNTVGPNFDDVWQGKPLPTTVVN
jgi:hypothetical protein